MAPSRAGLAAMLRGFFPDLLGVRLVAVAPDRVVGELDVRPELCTVPGILHGGVTMAFADTLGAVGTVANLPGGASTATIEPNTNVFAPGETGMTLRGNAWLRTGGGARRPGRGGSPHGRLLAVVIQTQLVILPPVD